MIVYKLIFPDGTFYIGCTKNLKKRLREHNFYGKNKKNHQRVSSKINQYGINNFITETLFSIENKELAFKLERKIILSNKENSLMLNSIEFPISFRTKHSILGKKRMTSEVASKMSKKLWSNPDKRKLMSKISKDRSSSCIMRKMAIDAVNKRPFIVAIDSRNNEIVSKERSALRLAKSLNISEYSLYRYLNNKRKHKFYNFKIEGES